MLLRISKSPAPLGGMIATITETMCVSFGRSHWMSSGISRHGVSLLSGGFGRLHTRLDTPPSINRRHPDSGLALEKDPFAVVQNKTREFDAARRDGRMDGTRRLGPCLSLSPAAAVVVV